MFTQIIKNTPPWVWGLLLGLIALGWSQAVARRASLKRVLVLPTVMSGLSLAGLVSAFGVAPGACAAWLLGALAAAALVLPARLPAATVWDAQARQFQLPAGWTPMLLILGIFFTKYGVGVALALQPGLAQSGTFSQLVSGLYGAFSGIFLARAARLWRLSRRPELAQRLLKPASARIYWPKRAAIVLAALVLIPVLLLAGLIGLGGTQAPPVASAMGKVMSDRVYQDLPELSDYAPRDGARLAQLPLLPRPDR